MKNCVRTCLYVRCMPQEFGRLCGYAEMFANVRKETAFYGITNGQRGEGVCHLQILLFMGYFFPQSIKM